MSERDMVAAIKSLGIFSMLSEEQVRNLAREAAVHEIPKDGLYISEESTARGMHVLLSGKVKLFKMSQEGREQTIFIFTPGEPFCLCHVFSDGPIPASIAALENSRILVVTPAGFARLSHEDPALLLVILRVMSRRLKDAMTLIESLSLRSVPSRLADYLLTHGQGGRLDLGFTHREFAKFMGITPEALSRTLKRMSEAGLVRVEGSRINLLDMAALQECRNTGVL